jgi:hypothetical protein
MCVPRLRVVPAASTVVVTIALAGAALLSGCASSQPPAGPPAGSSAATSAPAASSAVGTSAPAAPAVQKTGTSAIPVVAKKVTAPDGTYAAFIKKLAGNDLTYDRIDYFQGAAAPKACREDHLKPGDTAWCNDYYYRNVNPALVTVPLSSSLQVRVYGDNPSAGPVVVTLAQLRAHLVAGGTGYNLESMWHLTIRGGQLVRVEQIYTP